MTCDLALELLLDAEPTEFCANEPTALGEHLRGCVRCRRVAAQLLQDTKELALVLRAVPMPRHTRSVARLTMIPAFAMAALLVGVVLRYRSVEPTIVPVMAPVTVVVTPVVTPATSSPAPTAPLARHASERRVRLGREFARAVPLNEVPLAPSGTGNAPLSVESSGVTITPASGTRATVMHTSNPKLVVVWLY